MADANLHDDELWKILRHLQLGGADTMNVDHQILGKLNDRLPTNPGSHWYCSRAEDVTKEAAMFLLRMLAYDGARAHQWRANFVQCLTSCVDCVVGVQEAKVQSRRSYFGAFQDSTLRTFYDAFTKFEVSFLLEDLQKHGITDNSSTADGKTLADVSSAVVCYILSDPRILGDSKIYDIVQRHAPKRPITGLPMDAPPVGLFMLAMAPIDDTRKWAQAQLTTYTVTPMPADHYLPAHSEVLAAATNTIHPGSLPCELTLPSCITDKAELWAAYSVFLRYTPRDKIPSGVVPVVIAHLYDTDSHFLEVLKSFLIILDRRGPDIWLGQEEEYPRLVFSSIKDNPVLSSSLEAMETKEQPQRDWLLTWSQPFVKSLNPSTLPSVLPLVMQFLCEAMQHERFSRMRPIALTVAAQILTVVLPHENGTPLFDTDLVWDTVDIHAGTFVSVAFGKTYLDEQWKQARITTRKLVRLAMKTDTKTIVDVTAKLATASASNFSLGPPKVREQLWKKMYESILPNDSDALATVFERIAAIAHMDRLASDPWTDKLRSHKILEEGLKVMHAVNHGLDVFLDGYSNAISRHLDFSDSIGALELLKRPGVVKNIMTIMLSPLDELREPAQGVVGLAFDADSRLDCLRALLLNFPNAAMEGMIHYLEVFNTIAAILPEACSMSKALAVCLTDVIDVLCSTPNGLVHQNGFLKTITTPGPEVLFPKWWSLMCHALSVIFQRTPKWAIYFENETMVVWMRDALIFGRDMLAQRKVLENASETDRPQSPTKRTVAAVGRKMVDDLQSVLFDLTKWLRLTDEELLHQAFALLQSLLGCFKETSIKPRETTLEKLQGHVKDARHSDPKRPQTRLDATRVRRLADTISYFIEPQVIEIDDDDEESDTEVQIVAPTTEKKSQRKPIRPSTLPTKSAKPKGQQKLTWPIPAERYEPVKPKASSFTKDDQARLAGTSSMPKFSLSRPVAPTAPSTRVPPVKPVASSSAIPADESSGSEDEEEGPSLEELLRKKEPVIKKPTERRQIIMLDMPSNVQKNPVLERLSRKEEARRVAMRLKPDISSLHRTILSWDYEDSSPHPPHIRSELQKVPDQFADVHEYRRVFEPLLLLEAWAQIQNSKGEPTESYQSNIVSRQYTNDWIDLDVLIAESVQKDWFLAETDVVLLKYLDGSKRHMGKIQATKKSQMGLQATVRLKLSDNDLGPQGGSTWLLSKVFSLTTLHREYAALMGLPYYDLCDTVLKARLSKPAWVDSADVKRAMASHSLNEPQAKAILSALETDGFSLIQGPPGTGKTSTICGLVQTFMSRRPKPTTAIHVGRSAGPADKEPPKKILLCAPSNAAIDEITLRLKEGISGPGKRVTPPKVVRVGAPKGMNVSIRDVSLDQLVEQKLNDDPSAKNSRQDAGNGIALVRAELEKVKHLRQEKLDEMSNIHDNTAKTLALEEEVRKLNKQKTNLTHQLDKLRDKQKSDYRAVDAITRKFRAEVLFEADVICSTLSGAGHEQLEPFEFEMVVIDEAAQAIELSSLIPMKYKCSRCVMVGDPQQLPPTVISPEASSYGYNQSLFVRLQKQRPDAVHLLSIQYRMHPEISVVPSRLFYDGRLLDGPDMGKKTLKPWHANEKFGEYRFFNVQGVEEKGPSHSLVNRSEVQVAVALYNRLRQEYSNFDFDFKIGIVTMYRAQVRELRRAFEQRFGANITNVVDFNTVDGFQGQEKDVIILSCVRAGPNLQSVGFLADVRRMNVALTRAKSSVFVLGNAPSLERSDAFWKRIVQDARERSRLTNADVAYFTSARSAPQRVTAAPRPKPASKPADVPLPTLATPKELAAASRSAPHKPAQKVPTNAMSNVDSAKPPDHDDDAMSVDSSKHPDDAMDVDLPMPAPPTAPVVPTEQGHPVAEPQRPPQPGTLQPRNAPEGQKPRPRPTKKPKPPPSLFIPKKRPAPSNDGPGPSTNRRKM